MSAAWQQPKIHLEMAICRRKEVFQPLHHVRVRARPHGRGQGPGGGHGSAKRWQEGARRASLREPKDNPARHFQGKGVWEQAGVQDERGDLLTTFSRFPGAAGGDVKGEVGEVVGEAGGGVMEHVGKGAGVPPRRRVGGAEAGTAAEPPHGAKLAGQTRDAKVVKGKPAGAPLRDRLGSGTKASGVAENTSRGGLGGAHPAKGKERRARKRIMPKVKIR